MSTSVAITQVSYLCCRPVWPTKTCCLHKKASDFMFVSTGLQPGELISP